MYSLNRLTMLRPKDTKSYEFEKQNFLIRKIIRNFGT